MLFHTAGSGTRISVAPSVFLFLILSHSQFFSVFRSYNLSLSLFPSLNLVNSFSSYQDGIG